MEHQRVALKQMHAALEIVWQALDADAMVALSIKVIETEQGKAYRVDAGCFGDNYLATEAILRAAANYLSTHRDYAELEFPQLISQFALINVGIDPRGLKQDA